MLKIIGICVATELARVSLLVMLRKSWVGHGNSSPLPGHSCDLPYLEIDELPQVSEEKKE